MHGPNILGSCTILFFITSDLTFTTGHIHNWVSFSLWPSHFILSGAIHNCLLLCPGSILDTFWPVGLIFWCHIFLPFNTVNGVLQARILGLFSISYSSGHLLSEFLTMTHPSWVVLHDMAHWVMQAPLPQQGCNLWRTELKYSWFTMSFFYHTVKRLSYTCVCVCVCVYVWASVVAQMV